VLFRSYLGQRSVGHIDPGAASTALVLQALAQAETATSQEEQA
ncbi:Dihydroxyacetone kinase, partial [human gut metagenome]